MIGKENLIFVERDGDAIGVFRDYDDATEMVRKYLVSYMNMTQESANKCVENEEEDTYMIYYHETCLFEKEGKVYNESLG